MLKNIAKYRVKNLSKVAIDLIKVMKKHNVWFYGVEHTTLSGDEKIKEVEYEISPFSIKFKKNIE